MSKDNYILPEQKARWGFSGTKDEIKVGVAQEVEKTTKPAKSDESSARKNGGGASSTKSGE